MRSFADFENSFIHLDIIETIVDCVCAGKARSGEIRSLEFDAEILNKAVNNTIKLIDEMTEVE